jgi:hypothetical protein
MNDFLLENNHIVIPNFICSDRAKELAREFKLVSEEYNFPSDKQALNSHSCYNYLPALELLCEKTSHVSDIIGTPVLPTYTYGRIYKNDSVLEKHTDRPACEISATVHLDGDRPWSIWIETPEGNPRCVNLNPGDAMIYLGCVAPHWRDAYRGEWYAQFFTHYVRAYGPCSDVYFDKYKVSNNEESAMLKKLYEEQSTKNLALENKLFASSDDVQQFEQHSDNFVKKVLKNKNIKEKEVNVMSPAITFESELEELVKKIAGSVNKEPDSPIDNETNEKAFINYITDESKENTSVTKSIKDKFIYRKFAEDNNDNALITSTTSTTKLSDYIVVVDDVIPLELCDEILDEYINTDLWNNALTGGGLDKESRRCNVIGLSEPEVINQNPDYRSKIDSALYECVANALSKYQAKFPYFDIEINEDSGYELLRYKTGDFYVQHTDSFKQQPRAISCTMCLNDDYGGGEFGFFDREVVLRPNKGSVIMFPSNFMYPHEVMPVTSGTRYSIITWLV